MLFEVQPSDLMTYIGVAIILTLVTLAASYVPARRATKVDPLVALRQEQNPRRALASNRCLRENMVRCGSFLMVSITLAA